MPASRASMKLGGYEVGNDAPLFLIAGPCVDRVRGLALSTAEQLKDHGEARRAVHLQVIVRQGEPQVAGAASGARDGEGLRVLERVRREIGVPVLTDVHEDTPIDEVAEVVDVLQTPAFLCRQTNFILRGRAGEEGRESSRRVSSCRRGRCATSSTRRGRPAISGSLVCERGFSFGYNNLVVDMRCLAVMRGTGCPVVFDATHSVQLPGAQGQRLRRRARAHPGAGPGGGRGRHSGAVHGDAPAAGRGAERRPECRGRSTASAPLLEKLVDIDATVKERPFLENSSLVMKSLQEYA